MIRHLLQPFEIPGRHGLLDQFDVQSRILHTADEPHGFLRLPALIGVEADGNIRPDSLPHSLDAPEIFGSVEADFDLDMAIPGGDGTARVGGHHGGLVDADRQIRHDAASRPAEKAVQRHAVPLAEQVVDGYIQSGLSRRIVDHSRLDSLQYLFPVVDVPADELRPDRMKNRRRDGLVAVAGNDDRRRRIAVADGAVVSPHLHDQILCRIDAPQGRFKGRL